MPPDEHVLSIPHLTFRSISDPHKRSESNSAVPLNKFTLGQCAFGAYKTEHCTD